MLVDGTQIKEQQRVTASRSKPVNTMNSRTEFCRKACRVIFIGCAS
jgi:hypothetical protein